MRIISIFFGISLLFQLLLAEKSSVKRKRKRSAELRHNQVDYEVILKFDENKNTIRRRKRAEAEIESECSPGSVLQDSQCTECPAGSYASGGSCVSCPKGTYQTTSGQSTCLSCPSGKSTISVGSDGANDCLALCTIPEVGYGTVSPAPGYDVREDTKVTITCNAGFQINNQNVHSVTCADKLPSCSAITTTAASAFAIKGSEAKLTCQITSKDVPSSCSWYKNDVVVQNKGQTVASDGNSHGCLLPVSDFDSADEAKYYCKVLINSIIEVAEESVSMSMLEIKYTATALAVKEGTTSTLSCAATNSDNLELYVQMQWIKDGVRLGDPTTSFDTPEAVLEYELADVTISQAGEYSCLAIYSKIGETTSASKDVIVRGLVNSLSNKWVKAGAAVTLVCGAVGDKQGTVTWTKNRIPIATGESIRTTYDSNNKITTSKFTIASVKTADASTYDCTVKYESTELYTSGYLYINDDEGLVTPPEDKAVAVGDTLTFTCVAGNPSSNKVTVVQWYKTSSADDVEVTQGVTNKDDGNTQYTSILVLANVELGDRANYYCKITYTDSSTTPVQSDKVTLFVRGVVAPTSKTPAEGDDVNFACTANGDAATITWYKDDVKISSGIKSFDYEKDTQTQLSVLSVEDVASGSEGIYKCEAVYTSDNTKITSGIATLVIYDAEVSPGFGILGRTATITCTIRSNKEPESVSWTKDGNVINNISPTLEYSIALKTATSKIKFNELKEADFGSYGCIAYWDGVTTSITSERVPFTQLKLMDVSVSKKVSEGDKVTLSCSINKPALYSATPILSWTKDGASVSGGTVKTEGTTMTIPLELGAVSLSNSGSYKCKATYPEIDGSLQTEDIVLFVRGWESPLTTNYLVAGTSGTITCGAKTESEPLISWIVGSTVQKDKITKVYKDNLLTSTLYMEQPSKDVTVTCRVTVSGVTIQTAGEVVLLDILSKSDTDVTALQSTKKEFTCVADGYQNPTIKWYKDAVQLTTDKSQISASSAENKLTSKLTLSSVSISDRGDYNCMVVYPQTSSFPGGSLSTKQFQLSVTTTWKSPTATSALLDSSVTLTCAFVSSAQATKINWKLNNNALSEGRSPTKSYNSVSKITTSLLKLENIKEAEFGDYKCVGEYSEEKITSETATLTKTTQGFSSITSSSTSDTTSPVTLTCTTTFSDTTHTVKWYKDTTEVTAGVTVTKVSDTSETHKLEISSPSLNDNGVYSCKLTLDNSVVVASQPINLFVRGFSASPAYNLLQKGSSVTVTCVVRGDFPDSLEWYKDDTKISSLNLKRQIKTSAVDKRTMKSELYTFSLDTSDSAEYKCVAKWGETTMTSDKGLFLVVSVSLANSYGIKSNSATLVCSADSKYKPKLTLKKDTTILSTTSDPSLVQVDGITTETYLYSYEINSVNTDDFTDKYSCVLEYNAKEIISPFATLLPVELLSSSKGLSVAYGDTLTLTCTSTLVSSTTVTTTWKRNDKTISNPDDSEGSAGSVYKASLVLTKVNDESAGSYRCSMEYAKIGTVESGDIKIGIDSFKQSPVGGAAFAGDTISLNCMIKASAVIRWKKGDDYVPSDDYTSTTASSESSSDLTYKAAGKDNSGNYKCEAQVDGKTIVSGTAAVTVYEFETSPGFNKIKVGEATTLSCSVKAEPSAPAIYWQRDGKDVTAGVTDTSANDQTKSSELKITSAALSDNGAYRCKAVFPQKDDFTGGALYSGSAQILVLGFVVPSGAAASEGDILTVTCSIYTDTQETVSWWKNTENKLKNSDSIQVSQKWLSDAQTVVSTLNIKDLKTSDTGDYTCSASFTYNSKTISVVSEKIKIDLSNLFLTPAFGKEGSTVTMLCIYDGTGTKSTIKFEKSDSKGVWSDVTTAGSFAASSLTTEESTAAKTLTGKSSIKAGSKLVVTSISKSQVGMYRCSMTDTLGLTTISVKRPLQLLSSSVPQSKMLIETGKFALLTCVFSGPNKRDIQPQSFSSSTDNFVDDKKALLKTKTVKMETDEHGIVTKTTTAIFKKLMSTDTPFKCKATFTDETYDKLTTSVESDVIEILTASMELVDTSVNVYSGVDFTFLCRYSFETKANVDITPTPDRTTSDESTKGTFTSGYKTGKYLKVNSNNEGVYKCKLSIYGYTLEKSLSVNVLELPAQPDPTALTIEEGDYNWIICTVTTDLPYVRLSWYTELDDSPYYYTTYRRQSGKVFRGISRRLYGYADWNNREFYCVVTVPANAYSTAVSYNYQRVIVSVGDKRKFEASSLVVYPGDPFKLTCSSEDGAVAYILKRYRGAVTVTSTTDSDTAVVTKEHAIAKANYYVRGRYTCLIKKPNRSYVALGTKSVSYQRKCSSLVNRNADKGTLTCSKQGDMTSGTTCEYQCKTGYSMKKKFGSKISTTCVSSGYWSHQYNSFQALKMPRCKVKSKPKAYKKLISMKFYKLDCGRRIERPDIFDAQVTQKITDVDTAQFAIAYVGMTYSWRRKRCKIKFSVGPKDAATQTPEELVTKISEIRSAIKGSKRAADDSVEEATVIECNAGSGASSDGLYCVECGEGSYAGNNECVDCPVGKYTDEAGQTKCKTCPEGKSTLGTGSTECKETCNVDGVEFGTMDPPAGFIVEKGTSVTTVCDEKFTVGDETSAAHTCGTKKYCTRVTMVSKDAGYVSKGQAYSITCQVESGDSNAKVSWMKDSAAVSSGVKEVINGNSVSSVLTFTAEASAKYECLVASDGNTIVADTEHEVTVIENKLEPTDDILLVGMDSTFKCTGQQPDGVDLPPEITPYINKQPTTGDLSGDSLTLTVTFKATADVVLSCSFKYIQVAEDQVLDATLISVGVNKAPMVDAFVPLNTPATVECDLSDAGTISIVKTTDAGAKSDLKTGTGPQTVQNLKETSAVSYKISCKADKDGKTISTPAATYTFSETKVVDNPVDQYSSGASASFTCKFPAGTAITFKKVSDSTLDLKSKTVSTQDNSGNEVATLTLDAPSASDAGQYYCDAGADGRSMSAQLYYVAIVENPTNLYIPAGDSATMKCTSQGVVAIKWFASGGVEKSGAKQFVLDGKTSSELTVTSSQDNAGVYYCVAQEIANSESANLVSMEVDLSTESSVAKDGDLEITCKVFGVHNGITLSNEGKTIEVTTPSDASKTMQTTAGTSYQVTFKTSSDLFTKDVTGFTCTAYYANFAQQHAVDKNVYYKGFPESPANIDTMPGSLDLLVSVSADPTKTFSVKLFTFIDENTSKEVSSKDISAGGKSAKFTLDAKSINSGEYYYKMNIGGKDIDSNKFKLTVYGALEEEFTINYPGSTIEEIPLTCIITAPTQITVTWKNKDNEIMDESPTLLETSYKDKILTSVYKVSEAGSYTCSGTVLGKSVSVAYNVKTLSFSVVPSTADTDMFYDKSDIKLTTNTPDSATINSVVYGADGNEFDLSKTIALYETRDFTSVVTWSDTTGLHSGEYETTDTIKVAGVYLGEADAKKLVAGETTSLKCLLANTPKLIASQVDCAASDGGKVTKGDSTVVNLNSASTEVDIQVEFGDELKSGDKVTITCTATFKVSSSTTTKVAKSVLVLDEKCSTTFSIDNGVLTAPGSSIFPSETVAVKCNDGYQISGTSKYTCSGGALWDTKPSCTRSEAQCSSLAPQGGDLLYEYPTITIACSGSYAPFTVDYGSLTCKRSGWDPLTINNPINGFVSCGLKRTPYSKKSVVTTTYAGGSADCNTDGEKTAAYTRFTQEVTYSKQGVTRSLVSCDPTADGYIIVVAYSVQYNYLKDHDLLELNSIGSQIQSSDGKVKRATVYTPTSVTWTHDLSCPLGAPAFLDQCVECPVGHQSTGTQCTPCSVGNYQHEAGKTYCLKCAGGKTTPGMGTTTISECGESCTVPTLSVNGITLPQGGATVTQETHILTVCDKAYDSTTTVLSCTEFSKLDMQSVCGKVCKVPTTMITSDHIDILAGLELRPREIKSVTCVDGYKPSNYGNNLNIRCIDSEIVHIDNKCEKDGLSAGYIVLIIILVLLAIILLIIVPVCCMMKDNEAERDEEKDLEMRPQSSFSCSNHVIVKGSKTDVQIGNSNPCSISNFNNHINRMTYDRNQGFINEFRSISVGTDIKKIVSQMSENNDKNRYSNITTYDHSRVRLLKINNDPYSDYINASYINGYAAPNAYIATQGPLQNTVNDFWRMVWEQNISSVVMLTNLIQASTVKCYKYWPDSEQEFGVVKVKKMSENKLAGFVVRELEMEVEGQTRTVFQYHYVDWPEVGYPAEDKFLTFLYYIRYMRQDINANTPLVVHCSAGAGWTGVFIGLDITLDRLTKEDTVDVLGCVNAMRQQRSAMVQNEPQYIYLYKLLVECMNNEQFGKLRTSRFRANLEGVIYVNPNAPGIDECYEGGL